MNQDIRQAVLQRLTQAQPASLLGVGPPATELYRPYLADHPACQFTLLKAAEASARLPGLGRFDFALVADTLERLPKADAAALIARLRDVHAARFALAVELSAAREWSHDELVAFGLTRADGGARNPCTLYAYDIAHYKHTPDWLNSDNWAHPELYDKYRW